MVPDETTKSVSRVEDTILVLVSVVMSGKANVLPCAVIVTRSSPPLPVDRLAPALDRSVASADEVVREPLRPGRPAELDEKLLTPFDFTADADRVADSWTEPGAVTESDAVLGTDLTTEPEACTELSMEFDRTTEPNTPDDSAANGEVLLGIVHTTLDDNAALDTDADADDVGRMNWAP